MYKHIRTSPKAAVTLNSNGTSLVHGDVPN
jgi:hypothetical protein